VALVLWALIATAASAVWAQEIDSAVDDEDRTSAAIP